MVHANHCLQSQHSDWGSPSLSGEVLRQGKKILLRQLCTVKIWRQKFLKKLNKNFSKKIKQRLLWHLGTRQFSTDFFAPRQQNSFIILVPNGQGCRVWSLLCLENSWRTGCWDLNVVTLADKDLNPKVFDLFTDVYVAGPWWHRVDGFVTA